MLNCVLLCVTLSGEKKAVIYGIIMEVLWNCKAVTVLTEYKVMHIIIIKKKSVETSHSGITFIYTFESPEVKNVLDSSLMFTAMYLQGLSSVLCLSSDSLIVTVS